MKKLLTLPLLVSVAAMTATVHAADSSPQKIEMSIKAAPLELSNNVVFEPVKLVYSEAEKPVLQVLDISGIQADRAQKRRTFEESFKAGKAHNSIKPDKAWNKNK